MGREVRNNRMLRARIIMRVKTLVRRERRKRGEELNREKKWLS